MCSVNQSINISLSSPRMNWKQRLKLILPRYQKLILDYPVVMKPRYGHGQPPLAGMLSILQKEHAVFEQWGKTMLKYMSDIHSISPLHESNDLHEPKWNNGFLPGLDMVALYGILREVRPSNYVEVGSGNSTKVAFKAKKDGNIPMKMVSIDPYPRAEIDALADEVIRRPFEDFDWEGWKSLQKGDVVFIDNSHRVLPNSDAMVFFMEILPQLPKGVIVHIHDIYWPMDYPQEMCDRFYSEQYLLGAFILADAKRYRPIFPAYYFSQTPSLANIVSEMWNHPNLIGVEQHGGSFWLEIG
jgi:Methyltransferase domain